MNITFSQSLTERVNDLSVQPGSSFMNNGPTSAFSYGFGMTAVNVIGAAGTVMQAGPLIAEITTTCATEVVTELTAYTAEAIGRIIGIPMKKLSEEIAAYTTSFTYSPQDVMNNLANGWDKVISDAAESAQQSAMKEITRISNEKSKSISDENESTITKINKGIGTITAYIARGPEILQRELNTYCSIAIDESKKAIGKIVNDAENAQTKWIDNTARFIARYTVKPVNDALEWSLKAANDAIEFAKKIATAIAKAAAEVAIMAIIGLLGA